MKATTTVLALTTAAVLLIAGYGKVNSFRGQVIARETTLSAHYQGNQAQLSMYALGLPEQTGIADRQAEQLRTIFTDVVQGRNDRALSAAQNGQGALFSAISEAYPNIDLKSYDKIVEYIQKSREEFRQAQESLLDDVAGYETLLYGDMINNVLTNILGVPTRQLQARNRKTVVYGKEALAQMKVIVTDSTTSKAFEDGTMKPLTSPALPAN
jgi:hypothetical protein